MGRKVEPTSVIASEGSTSATLLAVRAPYAIAPISIAPTYTNSEGFAYIAIRVGSCHGHPHLDGLSRSWKYQRSKTTTTSESL